MRRSTDKLVIACAALCLLCTVVTVVVVAPTTLDTSQTTARFQESRALAQRIFCASNSAVIDAGRSIITGGTPKPGAPVTEFERNLRELGWPPRRMRRAQADQMARAYGRQIAQAVQREIAESAKESKTPVRGLVRKDGSLNCDRLAQITAAK